MNAVVGIFLIINTFSILVAQRSRELALLRRSAPPAGRSTGRWSPRRSRSGFVGSTVGLGVGYLLALGLRWLFGQFGLDLSRAEFPVTWSTVAWSYGVGLVVTAIASILPAIRASRIAPMAALRDDVALPEATLRRRFIVGPADGGGRRRADGARADRHRRHHRAWCPSAAASCWC